VKRLCGGKNASKIKSGDREKMGSLHHESTCLYCIFVCMSFTALQYFGSWKNAVTSIVKVAEKG